MYFYDTAGVIPFFYRAMKKEYGSDPQVNTLELLPGSKVITHEEGDFRLVDFWFTGLNGYSSGSTIIFSHNRPMWKMDYSGQYEEDAIPFLKLALQHEYSAREIPASGESMFFTGCRGPLIFQKDNLVYTNRAISTNGNWRFHGREEIYRYESNSRSVLRGFHEYSAQRLV